jgi:hypothetical protein
MKPRPPFVATVSALIAACGNVDGDPAAPACPAVLPATPECTSEGLRCAYDFTCQSGPATVTYACTSGRWTADTTCSFSGDWCAQRRLHCQGGTWSDYTGMGGNPPVPCPEQAPAPGSGCTLPPAFSGAVSCGYRCADGTWTEGGCVGAPTGGVWLNDGACAGDCSAAERALRDYAALHASCTTDADCKVLSSQCTLTSQHCSGAFAVGASADASEWAALDAALTSCAAEHGGSWQCATCNTIPPPPSCIDQYCGFAL